jgi:hypothetical protein
MFLSSLLLLTILFAFGVGVGAGYWAIFAILHLFDPARLEQKKAPARLAANPSGD